MVRLESQDLGSMAEDSKNLEQSLLNIWPT